MIVKRLYLSLLLMLAAGAAWASSEDLMPGSVPFSNHLLWNKAVKFGFDDNGTYTGETRWYSSETDGDCHATILPRRSVAKGYLNVEADGDAQRSINKLSQSTEKYGPAATSGHNLSGGKIFLDTCVTLDASSEPFVRSDSRDKLNCWLYVKEDGSVTNFIVTAGAIVSTNEVVATNYVIDADVAIGQEIQLMLKAVGDAFTTNCPGLIGFEIYVDGNLVSSDGRTVFPSAVSPTTEESQYIHSMGLSGSSRATKMNFTHTDPIENPEYEQDDVSMLLESAVITVAGYPGASDALIDFPMLVRVSEENIKGFYYSRCQDKGLDIRFTDENGQLIPHEIESWNPDGESLIWVKVPYFRRGAEITMHWALASATTAPENDRYAVWSEYAGVWHFATDEDGTVSLEDSSGNDYNLRTDGEALSSVESKIGTAGYASAATNFVAKDFSAQFPGLANTFTFTGWYKWQNSDRYQNTTKLAGKNTGNVYGASVNGWSMTTPSTTKARFYGDASSNVTTPEAFTDVRSEWGHVGLVYADGSATAYANACASEASSMSISLVTNAMITMTVGVAADELRIATVARTASWIAAECMQATNVSFLTYGVGNVKDRANYWIVEPTASPSPPAVSVEDAATLVFTDGTPRYGTPIRKFLTEDGSTELPAQPTTVGTYKCVTLVNDGVHDGLRHEIAFVIFEKRSYSGISGHDRIMLFNSDISENAPVSLQGYYDADAASDRVWYHGSADESEDPCYYDYYWPYAEYGYPFVREGVNHQYFQANTQQTKVLWQFRNCRIGNLYPEDVSFAARGEPLMEDGLNYLPWGGTGARRFEDSELAADEPRYAGQLLLRNFSLETIQTEEDEEYVAAAYSPLYTNGIGTIYFDAVNVYYECINKLKVQYCTFYDPNDPWYPGIGGWHDLPMDVFAIVDGAYEESMSTSGVTTATLAMDEYSGTYNWFYRIRAAVNVQTNIRFRIVRCDDSSNMNVDDWDDPVGLIAIDNIIVSNPGMGATISQFGAPADSDNLVLRGQRAPFDVAFPTAADLGSMHAQVKVDYLVNNDSEIDTSFIGVIAFRYRWRYLNQLVNSWREITLSVDPSDPHRWISNEPLVGEGTGDIEYKATAIINAPYYVYYDYSGLTGWIWPDGYSERHGNSSIDAEADGVYSTGNLSPALGTDYFVRLRDGASEYEGIRVIIRRTKKDSPEGVADEVLELDVTSDHMWRGYYLVETNGYNNIFYRVEAYNRQTEVGIDYQWNTNYLKGVDQDSLPASEVWETGATNEWTKIPCDELTGRILFQVDDQTWAASIIHAEYQNFNSWTDACRDDALFLGVSQEGSTSGVSRLARDFACGFTGFQETVATNNLWYESFTLPGTDIVSPDGRYGIGKDFGEATTPGGWRAQDGRWVCERYREMGGKSQALELNPGRFGWLEFHKSKLPRGVDTLTYYARTSQSYGEHSFNYYHCSTNQILNLSALTFAVPCAMRVTGVDDDFHGEGSVSVVARYIDGVGGYEVRADRVASNTVSLSIYKWTGSEASLVGTSPVDIAFTGETDNSSNMGTTGVSESRRLYGALFISVTNTTLGVRVTGGILANRGQKIGSTISLNEQQFYCMSWEDTSDVYSSGTVGVGSKGCPAVFARPVYSKTAYLPTEAETASGNIVYWENRQTFRLHNERLLLASEDEYDNWVIFSGRLPQKALSESPRNLPGFKAIPLSQEVYVQASENGTDEYQTIATNTVSSFGFECFQLVLRECKNYLFRIKTGESGSTAIVVDDLSVCQWQGEDYDDTDNPNRFLFANRSTGSPTNFVYTTSWVTDDNGPIELTPLRTSTTLPAAIRSPLMDGDTATKRGLGLGSISFRYLNADQHARILVQIATNGVGTATLQGLTAQVTPDWETVRTISFDEMSEDERAGGLISTYIGLHGVKGVMRILVDPTVVTAANDATLNPDRDPAYGRIYITMVAVKDNPRLDSGSWWGWNLRTTEEANRNLLKDGDLDPRLHGLSYALNNSVTASTIEDYVYTTHKPFLQTPILERGSIGEVSFKARKYSAGDPAPSIAIYAMTEYDPAAKDRKFTFLTNIVVNCDRYERFTFMAPVGTTYTAFRFAVTGVSGVKGDGGPDGSGPMPASGYVRRVMLDEVSVFEAIKARLGFRKVGAFRTMLGEEGVVANVPSASEQPICNESWGVQAEIYPVRLSEKVDYDRTPKVYLHWYQNVIPWGYEKWKNNANANTVELKPATTGSLVYRSNLLTCPDAVMPAATSGNTTFQYMLEVVYYMQNQPDALTNQLDSSEWSTPEWYRPIDYNVTRGLGENFSAYTIIDSVPSGWAWINEINLFARRVNTANTDINNQYIEIAAPVEANLKNWTIRVLTPKYGSSVSYVHTNVIMKFDSTSRVVSGQTEDSKDIKYAASNMVFYCVGSPATKNAGKLTYASGTLDRVWKKPGSVQGAMKATGELEYAQGMGFQLVRPSGIVEHELVAIGTNFYREGSSYFKYYSPTNAVRHLNEHMDRAEFFYAGADESGTGKSLGVFDSFGESSNYWNNTMIETPGRINQYQFINPDHPVPIGTFVTVYFNLLGDHIYQTVGTGVKTNVSQVCFVRKESAVGTNVTYNVDTWYELADVSSSDGVTVWNYSPNLRNVTVPVAVNSQKSSITVTAQAQVSQQLRDLGCDGSNRYTPAIIDWLEKQKFLKNVYGLETDDWPDSDGQIYLAGFMGLNRQIVAQMTLTQMYWLDLCPTISNQCLVAGMASAPTTVIRSGYEGTPAVTNRKMDVFMMLTNSITDSSSPYYGKAWAPYVLRGVVPGTHSQEFGSTMKSWTNETFKITGILANGLTSEDDSDAWVPQRLFVFNDNSFSNFTTRVQVPDPHSPRSLGYQFGWGQYWLRHPEDTSPIFFSWSIDTRSFPVSVEVLKADETK